MLDSWRRPPPGADATGDAGQSFVLSEIGVAWPV